MRKASLAIAILLLATVGASANLLVNGDFDTGALDPWVTFSGAWPEVPGPGIMTGPTVWTPGPPTSDGYLLGTGYAGNMGGGPTSSSGAYQTFTVAPNSPLRISGDIGGGIGGFGNFNGNAFWEVRLIDGPWTGDAGAGVQLWRRDQTVEGGFGWTHIDVTTNAGTSGSATLVLRYHAWDPQWDWAYWGAYFDTFSVEITTLPPVIISNVQVTSFTDTTATIEWDTNVYSTSTVDWGLAPVPPYSNSTTGPDGTHHVVNLTGLPPGSIIHYSVRSTAEGYEPASSPDAEFATPIQFRDIGWQWGATADQMIINWNTVIDARLPAEGSNNFETTSQVRYGLDPNNLDQLSPLDNTLTAHHSVTLMGLQENKVYYYRVLATRPGYNDAESATYSFKTISIQPYLKNGAFEDTDELGNPTIAPWEIFGSFDGLHGPGVPPPNDNTFGVDPHSPTHYAGDVESYGNGGDMSGAFQRVATTPGQTYILSSYVYTQEYGGVAQDVGCRIGVDPYGGIDPNSPLVIWYSSPDLGPWHYTQTWNPPYTQLGWQLISVAFTAPSNVCTVFLQVHHQWPLQWNITAFDDVSLSYPAATIGEAKSRPAGWPVDMTGKIVTYVHDLWPYYCYIQEDDRSAGIKVVIPVDQPIPALNNRIDVVGTTEVANGEAQIAPTSITISGSGDDPAPLAMNNKAVGGGPAPLQPGVENGAGLGATGLLVKVFGKCNGADTVYNPDNVLCAFWIDDGSNVDGGARLDNGTPMRGLKVYYYDPFQPAPYQEGHYLLVRGVAGAEMYDPTPPEGEIDPVPGDEYPIRVLYMRNSSDIVDLGP